MAQERIQKILSRAGIASRRKAEELVLEGVVTINGRLAKIGDKAELGKDAIKVGGKLIQGGARPPVYVAFNKPRGVISMFADPEGRPTLNGYFNRFAERLFPVGRLDFMSEGLLLVTNDGEFAERVQKSADIPRVYRVKIKGRPEPGTIEKLGRPTRVDGKLVHPHSVKVVDHLTSKSLVEVVLIGAGGVDIKSLFERNGLLVDRITRTSIGQVALKGMAPGAYRLLRKSQADAIFSHPELAVRTIEQEQEKSEKRVQGQIAREGGTESDARGAKLPVVIPRREGARAAAPHDRAPRADREPRFDRVPRADRKPRFDRGDRAPKFDRGDRAPKFDRGDRAPKFDRGDRAPKFDRGDRAPKFDRGDRAPKFDRGDRAPKFDRGDRAPKFDRGDRAPKFDRGDRAPKFDRGDRAPKFDRGDRAPKFDRGDRAPRFDRDGARGTGPQITVRPRSADSRGSRDSRPKGGYGSRGGKFGGSPAGPHSRAPRRGGGKPRR